MLKKILLAFDKELVIAEKTDEKWNVSSFFRGANPITLASDPNNQERIYCSTFDRGLWRSVDGGTSWEAIGTKHSFGDVYKSNDIATINSVTKISVSPLTGDDGNGIIYVGTEPSALFISKDGGDSFGLLTDYHQIPSKSSWFFPQRTYTHHVKWIEIDSTNPKKIYTTIEVGGLITSLDEGITWNENKESDYAKDIHVLKSHSQAPNRLYGVLGDSYIEPSKSVIGGQMDDIPTVEQEHDFSHDRILNPNHGYAESYDGGKTWSYPADGLKHHYAYHLAVNPSDADNVIIATATDPMAAHVYQDGQCESTIYRKEKNGVWEEATLGLPKSEGTLIPVLHADKEGCFYLFSNKGVFYSSDKGTSWTSIEIPWEPRFVEQHPYDMLIID